MKWITEIVSIEAYKITCKWNNNEIKTIDLGSFILKNAKSEKSSFYQLLDKKRFNEVKCDGTTIYWENGIKMIDYDGMEKPAHLDIDPHVLYEMTSKVIHIHESV